MRNAFVGFDWDEANTAKCQKHGVSLQKIEELFEQPVAVEPDVAHSASETRFRPIGLTRAGRHVFLVFTLRRKEGGTRLRAISARYMHRKEIRAYEEKDT